MTAVVNGIQYIGGQTSPDEFIKNQAGTIDGISLLKKYLSWKGTSLLSFIKFW